MKAATWIF